MKPDPEEGGQILKGAGFSASYTMFRVKNEIYDQEDKTLFYMMYMVRYINFPPGEF